MYDFVALESFLHTWAIQIGIFSLKWFSNHLDRTFNTTQHFLFSNKQFNY